MGGSNGILSQVDLPTNGVFVDVDFLQGETMLQLNASMRTKFVKYIKDSRWTEALRIKFIDSAHFSPPSSSSTWTKFGYKSPHCSGGTRTDNSNEISHANSAHSTIKMDTFSATSNQLFSRTDLRAILIAVLLPMFFASYGGCDTGDNSISEDWRNEDTTVHYYTQVRVAPSRKQHQQDHNKPSKAGRLETWLVKAATAFKKSELDEYLANPADSFIKDLQQALQALPASVTIGSVDREKQESRIVYSNACEGKGHASAHLHELYSTGCSPGGVVQVSKAVFDAKRYKRCVTSMDGTCKLRALKPVFSKEGRHIYTLGLESYPFVDPVLQLQDSQYAVSDETFQQIEDLLHLLPLLIRH